MSSIDLNKFKKISANKTHTTFQHPDGHVIHVAHKKIHPDQKGELMSLPVAKMAKGGQVPPPPVSTSQQPQSGPNLDPVKVANFKPFADGGQVAEEDAAPAEQQINTIDRQPAQAMHGVFDAMPSAQNPAVDSSPQYQNPIGADNGMPEGNTPQQIQSQRDPLDKIPGYKEAVNANNLQAQANTDRSKAAEQAIGSTIKANQQSADRTDLMLKDNLAQIQAVTRDIDEGHINPNHYMENMSVGGKIATAIGLILGGYGTQGKGPNPAMEYLNAQINRDLEAQKANLNGKHNLLSALQAQYKDTAMAETMFRSIRAADLSNKLDQAAAKAGTQEAQARKLQAQSEFMRTYYPALEQMSLKQAISGQQQGGQPNQMDPSQAVSTLVPKEHQKAVFEEIKKAQNVKANEKALLAAFDEANDTNTIKNTIGGLRTPVAVKTLHNMLLPIIKDTEGRVNEFEFDTAKKAVTPTQGDFQDTVAKKREALKRMIHSASSAPTAKGYGIDLEKFQSTRPSTQIQESAPILKGKK